MVGGLVVIVNRADCRTSETGLDCREPEARY